MHTLSENLSTLFICLFMGTVVGLCMAAWIEDYGRTRRGPF